MKQTLQLRAVSQKTIDSKKQFDFRWLAIDDGSLRSFDIMFIERIRILETHHVLLTTMTVSICRYRFRQPYLSHRWARAYVCCWRSLSLDVSAFVGYCSRNFPWMC
jgi:hypothetical protein